MRGKVLFCLIALCLLVVVPVSADIQIILAPLEDGRLSRVVSSETFTDIRTGAGTAIDTAATGYTGFGLASSSTSSQYTTLRRGFYTFNTTLPEPGTITSAVLSVYGYATSNTFAVGRGNISVTSSTHGYPAAASDYNKYGDEILTNAIEGSPGWQLEAYNNFTFTNLSYFNTSGNTMFMLRGWRDTMNDPPTWSSLKAMTIYGYPSATAGTNKDAILTLTYTPAGGDPPVADFTANETTVCTYDYVQFNDTSTGTNISTWFWLFGDSQDSHIQDPVHYWDTPGSYTVNLTAGNGAGENTTSKTDYITVTDCTPPASITNLNYTNETCQNTTWTWDNPLDADYDLLMVYKNGEFDENITAPANSLSWLSITAGEFASHTCDATGNCNTTWVNATAPDAAVCDETPPLAPINLANVTTCSNITWTWENVSGDTDYHGVLVYRYDEGDPLGDYFYHFVIEPTFTDFWDGLDENTNYTISLKSWDGANVNDTWVNMTAHTPFCSEAGFAAFTANVTCRIGVPAPIEFTGNCDNGSYKNHWDFGDGSTNDDDQSPVYSYTDYGIFNVSHSCNIAPGYTLFENKTDYITIGVNGTVCAADCTNTTGNCTTCTGDGEGEEYPNYLLIGACIGLLFGYITIRRNEMK